MRSVSYSKLIRHINIITIVACILLLGLTISGQQAFADGRLITRTLNRGEKLRVLGNRCNLKIERNSTSRQRYVCRGTSKAAALSNRNVVVLRGKDRVSISARRCFLTRTRTTDHRIDVTCARVAPTPTPTPTIVATQTPTSTITPTPTATFTPSATPTFNANALLFNNQLVGLNTGGPIAAGSAVSLTGVNAGDVLAAMDRRPQNGMLYALGYNGTNGTLQLYAVSPESNSVVAVGTTGTFSDGVNNVRVGVDATTTIGMDFNPAVDRIRVVTGNGQNFRMNPNTGAFVDGDAGTGGVNMDSAINGGISYVDEVAYTNSFPQTPNITTLYTVNADASLICIQNSANAGTETSCQATSPILDDVAGFDISPSVLAASANAAVTSGSAIGIGKLSGGSSSGLISIDLVTGAISTPAPIGSNTDNFVSFALNQREGVDIVGLGNNALVKFNSNTTTTTTTIAVTNLTAGETLAGIDWRPATGQLYGLGFDPNTGTGSASLYQIDPQTGVATVVGAAGDVADGAGNPISLAGATSFGFDFNPQVDRIRVVSDAGDNFRIDPSTAQVLSDTDINGATNTVDAAAYTNAFSGATSTTLYTLDAVSNSLYIQTSPNTGMQTAALPVTLNGANLDFTSTSGFDIGRDVRTASANAAATSGSGYAALTVGGVTSLYKIDLATAAATLLGSVGNGANPLFGLTVAQSSAN